MATPRTVGEVLIILAAAYPRFTIPPDTARAYASLLADIDDGLLFVAAKHHATSSKWFPSVTELRQAALEIRARAEGQPSPEEAWLEVMGCMGDCRYYFKPPEFSHPLIRRSVEIVGGYHALCLSTNHVADRAHFLKIYAALTQRDNDTAGMLPEVREAIAELSGQGPDLEGPPRLPGYEPREEEPACDGRTP